MSERQRFVDEQVLDAEEDLTRFAASIMDRAAAATCYRAAVEGFAATIRAVLSQGGRYILPGSGPAAVAAFDDRIREMMQEIADGPKPSKPPKRKARK